MRSSGSSASYGRITANFAASAASALADQSPRNVSAAALPATPQHDRG
jgi:hypothetical protein